MLPFLKRKPEGLISAQPIPELNVSDGTDEPDEELSGQGDDEFNVNNEDFLALISRIVMKHITRMR